MIFQAGGEEETTQNGISVWHVPGPEFSMSNESASQVEERVSGTSITAALSVPLWCLIKTCTKLQVFELPCYRDRIRLSLILCFTYSLSVFIIQKSVQRMT